MRTTQAEASSATQINSMNNLKYQRISQKEKSSTEIQIPQPDPEVVGLKYLIRRGNEKREFNWKLQNNKKRFNLNQEILLCNAQFHAERDLHDLQKLSRNDISDKCPTTDYEY